MNIKYFIVSSLVFGSICTAQAHIENRLEAIDEHLTSIASHHPVVQQARQQDMFKALLEADEGVPAPKKAQLTLTQYADYLQAKNRSGSFTTAIEALRTAADAAREILGLDD